MEDAGLDENIAEQTEVVDQIHGDDDDNEKGQHQGQDVYLHKTYVTHVFSPTSSVAG